MKANMASKRAAKAKRRKAVVTEKRKAELVATSLSEQVRIAAALPIQHCLLSQGFPKSGMGTLVLARGPTPWGFKAGVFLLDSLCLGIKDIIFSSMTSEQLEDFREVMADAAAPLERVEPSMRASCCVTSRSGRGRSASPLLVILSSSSGSLAT